MKKKLLSEAQVRRFMGLAGLKPINQMYNKMEEDELEEGKPRRKRDEKVHEGEMHEDEIDETSSKDYLSKTDEEIRKVMIGSNRMPSVR